MRISSFRQASVDWGYFWVFFGHDCRYRFYFHTLIAQLECYLRSHSFQLVRATVLGNLFGYRGKYRGPRLNCGTADAFRRSPEFVQSEVSIPGSHSYIVAVLEPTIFATLAIGTPAFSIHEIGRAGKAIFAAESGSPFKIRAALSFPGFLNTAVCLCGEYIPSGPVTLRREDIVLCLALREVSCPEARAAIAHWFSGMIRPVLEAVLSSPQRRQRFSKSTLPIAVSESPKPCACLDSQHDKGNKRARARLSASL